MKARIIFFIATPLLLGNKITWATSYLCPQPPLTCNPYSQTSVFCQDSTGQWSGFMPAAPQALTGAACSTNLNSAVCGCLYDNNTSVTTGKVLHNTAVTQPDCAPTAPPTGYGFACS